MAFLRAHGFNALRLLFNHQSVLDEAMLEPPDEAKYGPGAPWEAPELAHMSYLDMFARCVRARTSGRPRHHAHARVLGHGHWHGHRHGDRPLSCMLERICAITTPVVPLLPRALAMHMYMHMYMHMLLPQALAVPSPYPHHTRSRHLTSVTSSVTWSPHVHAHVHVYDMYTTWPAGLWRWLPNMGSSSPWLATASRRTHGLATANGTTAP